jgi:RNA recognition motif-containing protein
MAGAIRSTSFIRPVFSTVSPLTAMKNILISRSYVSKTVYIANIPWGTSEQILRDLGTKYGEVAGVRLPLDFEGRVRGFAFIEYNSEDSAQKAIENINGYELDGRQLRAAEASGNRNNDGGGFRGRGRGRGGFGGGFGGNRDNLGWQDRRQERQDE